MTAHHPAAAVPAGEPGDTPECVLCVLCAQVGGELIWQGQRVRVIRAQEDGFPAFYRVVWSEHVAEFSDLPAADRAHCMDAVILVEQALRAHLSPTKINLATLGNLVAHLHWHVIARFDWDSHFPAPVWVAAQRPRDLAREATVQAALPAMEVALRSALNALDAGGA